MGRRLHLKRGLLVAEPEEVAGVDGGPVLVFTPFFRRWAAVPRRAVLPAPASIPGPAVRVSGEPIPVPPPPSAAPAFLPRPGEAAARERLAGWVASAALPEYAQGRNRLDADGTSRLSADLKFGTLSALEVLEAAEGEGDGRRVFVSELAWREFYSQILCRFPHVLRAPSGRSRRDPWESEAWFAAWQQAAPATRSSTPPCASSRERLDAQPGAHDRRRAS